MSKNSAKSNYENLMQWLKTRSFQIKPKVTTYKK